MRLEPGSTKNAEGRMSTSPQSKRPASRDSLRGSKRLNDRLGELSLGCFRISGVRTGVSAWITLQARGNGPA
jgi:hypothetical protein